MATVEERVAETEPIKDKYSLWTDTEYMTTLANTAIQEVTKRMQGQKNSLRAVIEIKDFLVYNLEHARTCYTGVVQELLLQKPRDIPSFMTGLETVIRKFPPYISTDAFAGMVELEELGSFLVKTLSVFISHAQQKYNYSASSPSVTSS